MASSRYMAPASFSTKQHTVLFVQLEMSWENACIANKEALTKQIALVLKWNITTPWDLNEYVFSFYNTTRMKPYGILELSG